MACLRETRIPIVVQTFHFKNFTGTYSFNQIDTKILYYVSNRMQEFYILWGLIQNGPRLFTKYQQLGRKGDIQTSLFC